MCRQQFNLVGNKLVLFLLLQLLKWCVLFSAVWWNKTKRKENEKRTKNKNRYYWRGKITGMWTIFFGVCYLHFVHVRTTKHYFGWSCFFLLSSSCTKHTQTWTNNRKIPNNALSLRSTCRFFWDLIQSHRQIQFWMRSRIWAWHKRLSLQSNFPIFRRQYHSCIVCCCFVRLHKSIKNYVRFCRNFVPTIVKMSTERQIAYYCHFSFRFVFESSNHASMWICYNFLFGIICCVVASHRPSWVSKSADFEEIQAAQMFTLLGNQPIGCVFA